MRRLEVACQRQSRYYNMRRRDNSFRIGDKVLKRTNVLSSDVDYLANKLTSEFEGPYTISDKIGVNRFRVVDEKGTDVGRVHAKDLKPYYFWTYFWTTVPPPICILIRTCHISLSGVVLGPAFTNTILAKT